MGGLLSTMVNNYDINGQEQNTFAYWNNYGWQWEMGGETWSSKNCWT